MYCSVFMYLLVTFIGTACSKSIKIASNEDIESFTTDRANTTFLDPRPLHDESESESRLGTKRSLLILVPTAEKKDDVECKNQKTKRCKTSFLGAKAPALISKEKARTTLKLKNTENPRNNRKHPEYFVGRKPNVQLASLKKPLAKPAPTPRTMEQAKSDTFRDEIIINSLRKLMRQDPTVGAARGNSEPKTSVYDDGKFLCYCREKTNSSKKDIVSKPPTLPKKSKTEKRPNDKKILLGNKQREKPVHANVPHRPPVSDKLPATYPIGSRYPQSYLPNGMYPSVPQGEQGTIPYIPYIYHVDPRYLMPVNTNEEIPTNIHAPYNPVGSRPELIVGQRAPIDQQRDFNKDQQTVEQTPLSPPNTIGKSLSPSSRNTIAATTSKTSMEENVSYNNDDDSNLHSVQSKSFDKNSLARSGSGESFTEVSNVQAANPDTSAKLSTGAENEYANEYETTGSGTLDYSDIKEVTTAYFTSKAYTNETEHDGSAGHDDSFISSTGTMNNDLEEDPDHNVNLQSRLNIPTENSMKSEEAGTGTETKRLNNAEDFDQANGDERNVMLGKSDPYRSQEESAIDDSIQNVGSDVESTEEDADNRELKEPSSMEEGNILALEDTKSPNNADISAKIDDKDTSSNEESSVRDCATELPEMENNADPLNGDYERKNVASGKSEEKIDSEESEESEEGEESEERGPVSDSLTDETIYSVGSEIDYTTIAEDLVNTDNERVGAKQVTTSRNENEDAPTSEDDATGGIKDPSNQALPFCDNTLLQKSIKAVINNFATGDSSEMDGNANEETVASTKGEDLLPEIVEVPNLKGILSMPAIEHTVLDKVKNLLSKVTGIARKNFDSDWATDAIRNNLRNTMSAASNSKADLPPMAVEEHQFKNGKWVTNVVTLEPLSDGEARVPTDLEKVQARVKSLLRDPAVSLQAAKNPAVQNMIVESVRNTFEPENDETIDDSVIQSTLNNELNIMEMEQEGISTTEDISETTAFDVSNIDMDKLLNIAKSEAGLGDDEENESSTLQSSMCEESEEDETGLRETVSSTMGSVNNGLVGATRDFEPPERNEEATIYPVSKTNQDTVQSLEENKTPDAVQEIETQDSKATTLNTEDLPEVPQYNSITTETWLNVAATPEIQEKSSTAEIEDYTFVEYSSPTINPTENADPAIEDEAETTEIPLGIENTSTQLCIDDTDSAKDLAYLGKLAMRNENCTDDVQSLQNSQLFYIGDGVKLPLEIRKLKDGSYALSISKKVCEHLLNKECPCCVPTKGNVVRAVKRNSVAKNADKTIETNRRRISKRESAKSILPNERRKYDSADDSLQIFSMPVETFAKRYNLSLNLEKVQTPWNFNAKEKIDERARGRLKNLKTEEASNADADFHSLLSVQAVSKNNGPRITVAKEKKINNNPYENDDTTSRKNHMDKQKEFERYRYQRNIDENKNKRVEIVTRILNWLKDMILTTTTER